MKKLLLFLLVLPTLFYGQDYKMTTIPIAVTDITNTYMGNVTGSISITNNVLSVNFGGNWYPSSMKLGIIKALNASPPLPDIDLGQILISSSNNQPTAYYARIVNNNLVMNSYYGQPNLTGCYFNFKILLTTNNFLVFEYDKAGNQVRRSVLINPPIRPTKSATKVGIAEVNEPELKQFFPGDELSYYPNPVKEELYLKWELINDNEVTSIQVFSLNGQLLQTFSNFSSDRSHQISFQAYPTGVYMVIFNYKEGNQKSIKIVKAN